MFAPLSSSTTASATVAQRVTRLEKLLHEKSDQTGAIGSECQAGNENYDCGLSTHSLLLLSRDGPGGMALRAGPDAIPGARISLADDSQTRQTTGHPSPMEAPLHHNLDYENSLFCPRLQSLTLSTPLVTWSTRWRTDQGVVGGQHRPPLFFLKSSEALQQTLRQVIDAAGKTLGEQGRCQCFGSHHRLPRHPRLGCQEPLYNFTSPCVVAPRRASSTDGESETDGYISTHTCTIQYNTSTVHGEDGDRCLVKPPTISGGAPKKVTFLLATPGRSSNTHRRANGLVIGQFGGRWPSSVLLARELLKVPCCRRSGLGISWASEPFQKQLSKPLPPYCATLSQTQTQSCPTCLLSCPRRIPNRCSCSWTPCLPSDPSRPDRLPQQLETR